MVPPCVPACLFNMSHVVCEYMYIQDGHYAKAQRLSMTISVAMKVKTSEGNATLSHGQQRVKQLSKQSVSFVSTLGLSDNDDCVANSFSLSDSCVYTCKDV